MPELFSCPSCTGKLEYEGGEQLTVKCPYCGNSVIVPESLRSAGGSGQAQTVSSAELREILELVNAGRKIEAIKRFREVYGAGLREAKEAVEALEAGHSVSSAMQFNAGSTTKTAGRLGLGCLLAILLAAGALIAAAVLLIGPGRRDGQPAASAGGSGDVPARAPTMLAEDAPRATSLPENGASEPIVMRFGSRGIAPGQFNDPRALTIGAGGSLFVADYQGGRVQRFDADGNYLSTWELDPDKVIKALAADRDTNLYVVQGGDLLRYDQTSGELLGTLTYEATHLVSFDDVATATNGEVVAVNLFGDLVRFDGSGNLLHKIAVEDVAGAVSFGEVAVDGAGNVYMLGAYEDALGDRHDGVFVFNNQGQYVQRFGQSDGAPGAFTSPGSIAVDGQGRIYVSDFPGILVFSNSGNYLTTLPDDGFIFGMALNDAGELLATGNANQVVKYAPLD